jgi:hypothetical protein
MGQRRASVIRPGGRLLQLARLAMVALVIATGSVGKGVVAVAAVSCPAGYQCASVTFHLTGNGSGSVSANPDPPYEGCSLNGGVVTGCLRRNFYWSSGDPYLDIDLTFAPTADSYACLQPQGLPEYCGGAGTPLNTGISVYDGEVLDLYATFNLAKSLRMTLYPSGTGSGRVTSTPAGIDCGYAGGTQSGTCEHTWYFTGDFPYRLTFIPSPTSYFCAAWVAAGSCPGVGKTFTFRYTQSFDASAGFAAVFNRGTKVSTAVQGKGHLTSSAGGISCPAACTAYFAPSVVLALTAKPASGYAFTGWSGLCIGQSSTCHLTIGTTDGSTTAKFAKLATPPPPTAPPAMTSQPSAIASVSSAASGEPVASDEPSVAVQVAGGSTEPSAAPVVTGDQGTPAGQGPELLLPLVIALVVLVLIVAFIGYLLGGRRRVDSDQAR